MDQSKTGYDIIIPCYFYLAKKPKTRCRRGWLDRWMIALVRSGTVGHLNVHLVLVPGVLLQDNAALEDMSVRDILLRGQLRAFCRAQPHRRSVSLES
jgi:hypothetical protein